LAAGLVLVREAGGYATSIDGDDAILDKGTVVAGNEDVHRALLAALNDA
jgi:myo-inositol-1(or 4)-monophosphatase